MPDNETPKTEQLEKAIRILTDALLRCVGEDYDCDGVVIALDHAGEVLGRTLWPEKCGLCGEAWEECHGH